MARVAIATCRLLPEPDPDQEFLLQALHARGLEAEMLAWDDPATPPLEDFALIVLRSTWNYPEDPDGFRTWCERAAAATRLLNPLRALRWNFHKRYLLDLQVRGIPVVPTALHARGSDADLLATAAERGWSDVVVKPAIGAASFGTRRFPLGNASIDSEGRSFLAAMLRERDALVQPYLREVEAVGERAQVWIAGELTHCVRKEPRFAGQDESVSEALKPSAEERVFVTRCLEALPNDVRRDLLYARADLIRLDSGNLVLGELELLEPSLFLAQHPPALDRLAEAIKQASSMAASAP
ncbi:MAG: hypothetical protein O3A20_11420 [Planctomycetota bacterium]|nr:hypothetical protein [Planctomycetota bacterium]